MSGAPATRLPQREVQQNLQTVEAQDGFFSGWFRQPPVCCRSCYDFHDLFNPTHLRQQHENFQNSAWFETKLARPLSLGAHRLQEHPRGLNDQHLLLGLGWKQSSRNPWKSHDFRQRGLVLQGLAPSKSSMNPEAMSNSINSIEVAATQSCGCARLGGVECKFT